MGALFSCLGSCAGSCAGAACCAACKCEAVVSARSAAVLTIALLASFAVLALLFQYSGGPINVDLRAVGVPTHFELCDGATCSGSFAVYRVSFTLCVYFTLMTLLTSGTTKFGATAHRGYWIGKLLLLVTLLASTPFIDQGVFVTFREIARYMSFPFLLSQTILLIGFAYDWNGAWVERDGDNEGMYGWKGGLLLFSLLLFGSSFALWWLCWTWFTAASGCTAQTVLIWSTAALTLFASGIAVNGRIVPHGAIITSAVVTFYCSCLLYSTLASSPDDTCNPLAASTEGWGSHTAVEMAAGICLLALTLAAAPSKGNDNPEEALVGVEQGHGKHHERLISEDEAGVEPEAFWPFNLVLTLVSLYLSMLLTSWSVETADQAAAIFSGDPVANGVLQQHAGVGISNFWVKCASEWVCLLLYLWTLLAPYLLRDSRDFGIEFDDF